MFIKILKSIRIDFNKLNIYYKYTMTNNIIVYTDYTTKVLSGSTKVIDMSKGVSQYEIDYIFIHYDEMMRREVNDNADIIFNGRFQQFMKWVLEYKRIMLESRKNADNKADGPFGGPKKYYSCHGSHKYTNNMATVLDSQIVNGILDPKIFYDFLHDDFGITSYFENCSNTGTRNFINDVITNTEQAYNNYLSHKYISVPQVQKDQFENLHKQFNILLANTNDRIKNGDYRIRYDIIEQKLKDSVFFLDHLSNATNTEETIIENTANIADYYEKLDFSPNDVKIILPKDTIDLVETKKKKKELMEYINKYSSMSDSGIIANSYNIASETNIVGNVGSMAYSLTSYMEKKNNIKNPSGNLLKLISTKIYEDDEGNQRAKYLTEDELKELSKKELEKQKKYLEKFTTENSFKNDETEQYNVVTIKEMSHKSINGNINSDAGISRLARYTIEYPEKLITTGGAKNDIKPKYKFDKKSTQVISISQSGGREINIEKDLVEKNKISVKNVTDIQKQSETLDDLYKKQNELYFENKQFMDLDNLEQRNNYLIEMMNIIIIYNFLIGEKTNEHTDFLENMKGKMVGFKKKLTEIWDVMKANIPDTNKNSILVNLLASGTASISDIKELVKKIGIEPHIDPIIIDPIANSANFVKLVSALADQYQIQNMALIVNNLEKILTTKTVSLELKDKSIEDLYNNLFDYYSKLESLNASLTTAYNNIDISVLDMGKIKQFTGDIIEGNIKTANIFIENLITVLQNFNVKINLLENIRKEIRQSKNRLNDFKTYMKEVDNKMSTYDGIIDDAKSKFFHTNNQLTNIPDDDFIKNFYDVYVNKYTKKLSGASNNVIKYYSNDKDLRYVDEKMNVLGKTRIEYDVIRTAIYEEPNENDLQITNLKIDQDVTDDKFEKCADGIQKYLILFAKSQVPLFSKIMERINVPFIVRNLFDQFLVLNFDKLYESLTQYLGLNDKGDDIQPYPYMTRTEQLDLLNDFVNQYIKTLYFMEKYKKAGDTNNYNDMISDINILYQDYYTTKTTEDLVALIQSLLEFKNNVDFSMDKIRTDIISYLTKLYELSGNKLDPWNDDAANNINYQVIDQFQTVTTSLFYLFNEKIQYLYKLFNSLILTNNKQNPYFEQIKTDQHDLSKLNIISMKSIRMINRESLDNMITDNTNILVGNDAISDTDPNLFLPVKYNELYLNQINTSNLTGLPYSTFPLLDIEHNTKLPAEIRNFKNRSNYFTENALPLLALMKEMTLRNQLIINRTDNDLILPAYSLFAYKEENLALAYNYSMPGISSVVINGYDVYIFNTNNGKTGTVKPENLFNDYRNDNHHYALIPSFENDTMTNNGSNIVYTLKNIHYLNTNEIKIAKIEVENNKNITLPDIDNLTKLLNTANYTINFMDMLIKYKDTLKNLITEDSATWSASVNSNTTQFKERTDKKQKLLQVLTVLQKIYQTIKDNVDKCYGLEQVLFDKSVDSNGNNVYANDILKALNIVENANPSDPIFNSQIDKIWIFARKVWIVWYVYFAHMFMKFLLSNSYLHLYQFIDLLKLDDWETDLIKYDQYDNKITGYFDKIKHETNTKKMLFETEKNNYPIEVNSTKLHPVTKFIIKQNDLEMVEYDNYYSNIGSKTTDVYVLSVLIKNEVIDQIKEPLNNIEKITSEIMDLFKFSNQYLDSTFIGQKINQSLVPQAKTIDSLKNGFLAFYTAFTDELKLSMDAIGLDVEYAELKLDLDGMNNNLLIIINTPVQANYVLPKNIAFELDNEFTTDIYDYVFNQNDYAFQISEFMKNKTNYTNFLRYYLAQIYIKLFDKIGEVKSNLLTQITNENNKTQSTLFNKLFDTYDAYISRSENYLSEMILSHKNPNMYILSTNNSNDNKMYVTIFSSNDYQSNKKQIEDVDNVLRNMTSLIKHSLYDFYTQEIENYEKLINMNMDNISSIHQTKIDVGNKINKTKYMIEIISQVMFNEHYKKFAFVENSKLMEHLGVTINNFETIWKMIDTKLSDIVQKNNYHILTMGQINNYVAFTSAINKMINNENIIPKNYDQMSFGLIEYYKDIMDSILDCLKNKPYEEMAEIEAYLYVYHYITIKRCHTLFVWLREEYLSDKQREETKRRIAGEKFESILKHKIKTFETKKDVNVIFREFQGLRKYLDEYSAVVMDKVQLHLRINDFVQPKYNANIAARNTGVPYEEYNYLLDSDTEGREYDEKWNTGKLLFENENNGKILKVNFDLMDKINRWDRRPQKDYNLYYNAVYKKMQTSPSGIEFSRIYNTRIFPDSDVISNYMSIAPNISNNKGTVIMTYGYSGVGKSASLFGQKIDLNKGITTPSNGILQATMEQFSNVKIYFRIYEIYGLGTQYNYYWNPENTKGGPKCFPNFSQCIIHHVLDSTSDPTMIKPIDRIVLTNRHDMFAYITDLENPARTSSGFTINNLNDVNLHGTKYFDTAHYGAIKIPTYTLITPEQYRNFTDFVDEIDKLRKNGVEIKNLLNHLIKQIKGTINNPDSSRSILVYDFEINLNPDSANPIFVPFLIYDLPGKEDMARTYVDENIRPDMAGPSNIDLRSRVFSDIPRDIDKERKSTYVLNPLLIPIFDDNYLMISKVLSEISSNGSGYSNSLNTNVKMDASYEKEIVKKIIDYNITNFTFINNGEDYRENGDPYQIGSLYQTPTNVETFADLMNETNFNSSLYSGNVSTITINVINGRGITGVFGDLNKDRIKKEIKILICVVCIAFLIEFKLFDVIVEIINLVVNSPNGSDNGADGGWSRSKIYAFFEAYYINENVIGLLEYLIANILGKKPSGIVEQYSTKNKQTITDDINKNYKTANRYRALQGILKNRPFGNLVGDEFGFRVTPELLQDIDPLKKREIADFVNQNIIDVSKNEFANKDTDIVVANRHMASAINFENRGKYDTNKIFRNGKDKCVGVPVSIDPNPQLILNPLKAINKNKDMVIPETNRPLLQDFIEPYEQKISFYYIFYVVSNSQLVNKAEEQVKLLNNSMPFINKMDPSSKKKQCAQ